MNGGHLRAILWLRWRILRNRIRRAGKVGKVFSVLLAAIALIVAVLSFLFALGVGVDELPDISPMRVMVAWAGLALAFLFFWTIGLVTDLQRGDAMSLKNLLHLPVSMHWVFLYNYLSSFVSLSVTVFLPPMMGLAIAMVVVNGPSVLIVFPLLLGYFVMITGLTYQLRGWLGRLMENKRRGRSIVTVITLVFILLVQLPNLLNIAASRQRREDRRRDRMELAEELERAGPEAESELRRQHTERREREEARWDEEAERIATLVARVVPVGWLPYGVRASYEGRHGVSVLCLLGMASIGGWSLRRSYRTAMASLIGQDAGEPSRSVADAVRKEEPTGSSGTPFLERELPLLGEGSTAVALASLRSIVRAPEGKLILLSPVILMAISATVLTGGAKLQPFAPMVNLGAICLGLFSLQGLIQNQFGLDRDGFRGYVLSPIPRYQILAGKNLAVAPLAIGIGIFALTGLQFFVRSSPAHLIGGVMQLFSAYLICCLVGNFVSIMGPMRLKAHGMKAANPKWRTILWQVFSVFLLALAFVPLAIPFGVEFLLRNRSWAAGIPLFPVLHGILFALVFAIYRILLGHQGHLLQEREQRILETLTRK